MTTIIFVAPMQFRTEHVLNSIHIISYHIVVLKRQNRLKAGTNKHKLKVKTQSISDDDVRKTSWKATFWAGGERCIQTGKMLHPLAGCSRSLGQQPEKQATDGWSLDRWQQKTIGACRKKRPSAGNTAYWHERPRFNHCLSSDQILTGVQVCSCMLTSQENSNDRPSHHTSSVTSLTRYQTNHTLKKT